MGEHDQLMDWSGTTTRPPVWAPIAPAPGRKEAQDHDHRPPGPAQSLAQPQPRCPARRRDLALVPVLTPARAPGPALAPDPGRLAPRPAQRPAQAALGSVRVLAGAKGSEAGLDLAPARASGCAAADGSE